MDWTNAEVTVVRSKFMALKTKTMDILLVRNCLVVHTCMCNRVSHSLNQGIIMNRLNQGIIIMNRFHHTVMVMSH